MICAHPIIGSPGAIFRFQITGVQNVLACEGRLRITGPNTGHTDVFMLGALQAGIQWPLQAHMSYNLKILVQPHNSTQAIQISTQSSDGPDICSRADAGQIGEWTIDVL